MATIPLELPVKPSEAAALADLIFQHADGRALTDDIRNRLNLRAGALELKSLVPYLGSLQKDPVHSNSFFIAVDGVRGEQPQPLLLHIALASSPVSALFRDSILVGRMRPGGGREVVVNAIPFGASNTENVLTFARQIDRAFLPRPQGNRSTLLAEIGANQSAAEAAFDAFRTILRNGWGNMAAIRGELVTAIWAAVRAGWREGFSAEAATIIEEAGVNAAKEALTESRDYTRFRVECQDPSFASTIAEFLHELKTGSDGWKHFDLDIFLRTGAPTTPADVTLAARSATLVTATLTTSGDIDDICAQVTEIAVAARQANRSLSFDFTEKGVDAGLLQVIGKTCAGRYSVALSAQWNPAFLKAMPEAEPEWTSRKLSGAYLAWAATALRS